MTSNNLAVISLSLDAAQQPGLVPQTQGAGDIDAVLVGNELRVLGTFKQLSGALLPIGGADAAGNPESPIHVHLGTQGNNGPILRNLTTEDNGQGSGLFTGTFTLSNEEAARAKADGLYVNLHTQTTPGGELRGQIDLPPLIGPFGGVAIHPQALSQGDDFFKVRRGKRSVVLGQGGNDTLVGNKGRDRLYGGDGHDVIRIEFYEAANSSKYRRS